MNYKISLCSGLLAAGLLAGCNTTSNNSAEPAVTSAISYPTTVKKPVVDEFFGTKVVDPYRWLEDDLSQETGEWVKAQNKVTFNYLAKIPYREQIKQKLTQLYNYPKSGTPFIRGENEYFYQNDGLQNQYVLYKKNKAGDVSVFLDPNKFSADGTTSLSGVYFSRDGKTAAYLISEAGSDWRKAIVIDVASGKQLEPTLTNIKFSGLSWYKNEGFYYSSYDKPKGSVLSAKTDQHKLYYHKLGTPQASDQLIYGGKANEKHRYISAGVTEDDKFLVISGAQSTSGNDLFIQDLTKANQPLITILDNFDSDTYVIDNQNDTLFLVTNLNAPNKKLVKVNAKRPQPQFWQDVIAETNNVLSLSTGGGYLFANYMIDATSKLMQFDYQGNKIRDIALPGVGTASGLSGEKNQTTLYYSFTNAITPKTTFAFNTKTGESQVYMRSKAKFDPALYQSKQVFFKSKDGTKVPMIISYKKTTQLNGKNPTILYGYGGFNISLNPRFSPTVAAWLDLGGVYAVANLRGGGEYGQKWHNAGTKMHKQNVFDDFIAAGEYLIEHQYTSKDYLAINGGSNGGLLVGAVMTQRPDLMKVAIPEVGVLDMLRYHKFTAGAGWAYDYGTADDNQAMFNYLLGYSPVHNVKAGVNYPATLILTGDHDDRVVPAHSFKFAAQLQAKQQGKNPVLIRIETNAGHGAGTPTSKRLDKYADIYSFILANMGIKSL